MLQEVGIDYLVFFFFFFPSTLFLCGFFNEFLYGCFFVTCGCLWLFFFFWKCLFYSEHLILLYVIFLSFCAFVDSDRHCLLYFFAVCW